MKAALTVVLSIAAHGTLLRLDARPIPPLPVLPLLDVPRLIDDPQTIPVNLRRYYLPGAQFELCFDVAPDPKSPVYDDIYISVMTKYQWAQALSTPLPNILDRHQTEYQPHSFFPSTLRLILNQPIKQCWSQKEIPHAVVQPLFLILINPQGRIPRILGNITLTTSDNDSGMPTHLSLTQQAEKKTVFYAMNAFLLLGALYPVACLLLPGAIAMMDWCTPILSSACLLKGFYLFLNWRNYVTYEESGEVTAIWRYIPRTLSRLHDCFLLFILLLIASGRFISRRAATPFEIRFLSGATITIITYLAVFEVSVGGFQAVRYFLETVACICIITTTNLRVMTLTEHIRSQPLSRTVAHHYRIRNGYSLFRAVFIGYVLKPSALLLFGLSVAGEDDPLGVYLMAAFDYVADLLIMAGIMYAFRPMVPLPLIKYAVELQNSAEATHTPQNPTIARRPLNRG